MFFFAFVPHPHPNLQSMVEKNGGKRFFLICPKFKYINYSYIFWNNRTHHIQWWWWNIEKLMLFIHLWHQCLFSMGGSETEKEKIPKFMTFTWQNKKKGKTRKWNEKIPLMSSLVFLFLFFFYFGFSSFQGTESKK